MYKSCEVYLCFWEEGGANYMYVVNVTPLPCSHWPLPHLSPSHYGHSPPSPLCTGSNSSEVGQWCVGGGEEEDE